MLDLPNKITLRNFVNKWTSLKNGKVALIMVILMEVLMALIPC